MNRPTEPRAADAPSGADLTAHDPGLPGAGHLEPGLVEQAAAMSGIAVWCRNLDGDHVRCNEQLFRILGFEPDPGGLSAARVVAMLHPEDRARAKALNQAVLDGTGPLESQLRYRLGDGRVVHLLSRRSLLYDAQGRPTAMLGVTLDVTEREEQARRAARELDDARGRVALAVEGAGIGTWEWSSSGRSARWDDNMFRLRGLVPRSQAPSHDERMALVHPEDRERVAAMATRTFTLGGSIAYEFRIVRPDGQVRWLASRSVVVPGASPGEHRRIGANWDVTDRRVAEQAQRDAEVALRESQAKSRFLARMSHELRTPLNAVLGFTQLMLAEAREGTPAEAARRQSLTHVHRAGQHLLTLINDVLDLASVEGGETAIERVPVPLQELVSRTLPLVAPQAQAAGVALHAGPLALAVRADPTRLRQVLLNLLSNAVKYNRAGGEVHVDAVAAGALVRLRVRDTGRGIAEARLADLFQPFNRLGAEREPIEGSGIGLAIVKSLVEHMGGHVRVTTRLGEGSEFEVTLPRAASEAVPPREDAAAGAPGGPDMALAAGAAPVPAAEERRVLYIEDNEVNALIVQEVLATVPGFRLTVARDGASGLEVARREPPELVLLDMQLPDMDGFAVLRQLREHPRTAALPVVALSANVMPEQVSRGLAAGLTDYWTKPLDMPLFVRNLARLLPARTAAEVPPTVSSASPPPAP